MTRQLHLKDGTVHNHGPRHNPCPGSNKPPLGASGPSIVTLSSDRAAADSGRSADCAGTSDTAVAPRLGWSPAESSVIKHIPKSARSLCASHLAGMLRDIVARPEVATNWISLFSWSSSILQPPKRGGKRHNLTNVVKKRISEFSTTNLSVPTAAGPVRHRSLSPAELLAQSIRSKLEEGNVRAAVRLLNSDDTPALPSPENWARLQEKHPPASPTDKPFADPHQFTPLAVDEAAVRKAAMSFPAGSSGGPDGLRPQHLKELIQCRESGPDFLTALTGFVNLVLSGHCPADVAPIFFGGRLIALNKKSGGIRPIAVGLTLRRLASKCANAHAVSRLAAYFRPVQLGVGTPGGCEAAVHAARRFLETMPQDHVLVKLDFTNAFNCLHRPDMLQSIVDRVPELFPFCHAAYANSSVLYYGQYIIMSQEGPQQGDPLGPLLFCNSIHPLLISLSSALRLGYVDDVTLGGSQETVARDVQTVMKVGHDLGLDINPTKCELITHDGCVVTDPTLLSFQPASVGDAELLGAPLFPGTVLDKVWSRRCDDLARAVDRLALIGAQDALILLRASFSAPKVLYLMRCSPSAENHGLQVFDDLLRSAVSKITNSELSDIQWLQASMPIKLGGLGVRRVTSLAIPAFLASAASTLPLQDHILASSPCPSDTILEQYLSTWSSSADTDGIPDPLPGKQSFWDTPSLLADHARIESSLVEQSQRARFLAAQAPHSGAWLLALPVTNCGMRLDDEAVRVAVSMRLGLSLCIPHECRCGTLVDAHGLHAMVCKKAPGKHARHHVLNDIIWRAFGTASIPAVKEPSGLCRNDGKRPDGLTLIPWQGGKPLVWDATVVTPLASSYVDRAATGAGVVSDLAADRKLDKYSSLSSAYTIQPIAVDNLGGFSTSTTSFLSELGRRLSSVSNDSNETLYLFQRISVALQRFNSVLLHDSFPDNTPDQ